MTKILAGPQTKGQGVTFKNSVGRMPSIMQGSLGIYPHLKNDGKTNLGPARSLNQNSRIKDERRIMEENEKMLNRLQD
jgi:hypothetical protein